MPGHKPTKRITPLFAVDPTLVLVGDVRSLPIQIREKGRTFKPDVALWLDPRDGRIVGNLIGEPGQPAQTLVQALLQALVSSDSGGLQGMPGRLVVFDPQLADQMRRQLSHFKVQVDVRPRDPAFDALFDDVIAHLEAAETERATIDLPDDVLRPLLAAADRLWRAKPWEYASDDPPFAIVSRNPPGQPYYACVLGAAELMSGVAIYTSLDDYEKTLALDASPTDEERNDADQASAVLQVITHPSFLVSFNQKEETVPEYRDQLARCGWSRRLSVVPEFMRVGGLEAPRIVTADEAASVTTVVDALVQYCTRHRTILADDEIPPREAITVGSGDQISVVDVGYPPTEEPGPLYRFKVSLVGSSDVWRRIDIPGNYTLEDLHDAIQEAFGWDDDHLYSFFLSGKAWDSSTEYVHPDHREMGEGSAEIRLNRLNLHARQRFLYLFDYGDEWRHDIRVEKIGLKPDDGDYPRIVEAHGTPPPQYPAWDEDEDDGDDENDEGSDDV